MNAKQQMAILVVFFSVSGHIGNWRFSSTSGLWVKMKEMSVTVVLWQSTSEIVHWTTNVFLHQSNKKPKSSFTLNVLFQTYLPPYVSLHLHLFLCDC